MISKEQIAIISEQLGRTPIGALEVVTLDRDKQPAVLKVDPLADGKPFPSMYWLTSPLLHKAISHIESTAWIKEFENITLPQNEECKNRLKADNENYRKLRWDLFQTLHRSEEVSPAFVKVIVLV